MGEETDEFVESSSKMRETILGLSGVDIMKDPRTFKSTYEILTEISAVWDKMSDINQAALLETLGGKRQAAIVTSAITNLKDLQGAYETATNAAGTLADANEVYMDSINAQLGVLQTSWQSFMQSLADSDAIIAIVKALTALVNTLHKFSEIPFFGNGTLLGLGGAAVGIGGTSIAAQIAQLFGFGSLAGGTGLAATIATAIPYVTAIAAAIGIAVAAAIQLNKMFGENKKTLSELSTEYKNISEDLSAIDTELESNKARIEELVALKEQGTISTEEERELSILQKQNEELERQKILQEGLAESTREEMRSAALANYKAFEEDEYFGAYGAYTVANDPMGVGMYQRTSLETLRWLYDQAAIEARKYRNAQSQADADAALARKKEYLEAATSLYEELSDIVKALDPANEVDAGIIATFDNLTNRLLVLQSGVKGAASAIDNLLGSVDEDTFKTLSDFFQSDDASVIKMTRLAESDTGVRSFIESVHALGIEYKDIFDILSTNSDLVPSDLPETASAASDSVGDLVDGLDKLNSTYELLQTAQTEFDESGSLSIDTVKNIAELDAGLKQVIEDYLIGKVTAADVLSALSSYYATDEQNYRNLAAAKMTLDANAWSNIVSNENNAFVSIAKTYGVDLTNFKSLEEAKLAVQAQVIKTMLKNSELYVGKSLEELEMMAFMADEVAVQSGATGAQKAYAHNLNVVVKRLRELQGGYNSIADSINYAPYLPTNYQKLGGSGGNSGSSGSSGDKPSEDEWKKEAEQEIDDLDHLLALDKINKEKYYAELEAIENYYYKDSTEHEKQYAKEISAIDEKLYKGRQELFSDWLEQQDRLMSEYADKNNYKAQETLTKDILAAIEKRIAETTAYLKKYGLDENHELVQDLQDQWKKYAKDWVDTLCGAYDDYLDYMDDFDLWVGSPMTRNGVVRNLLSELETLYNQGFLTPAEYLDKRNGYAQSIRSDSQDAIDTILDAVKELIKADGEDEVEALEAQADAYAEIIDKRKEALALQKKEADHQKSIEEKLKQIAKLQSRIARLSLDDSREAQAKRASLESELSDLQAEVADANNDYAEDALTERLDKEKEAYQDSVEQRKEEIQAELDDEHQLYLKAIKMIESDTGSLYERLHQYAVDHQTEIDGPDSITTAWNTATEALRAYNGQLEVAYKKAGLQDAISISPSSFSDSLGATTSNSRRFVNLEDIVSRMYNRSVERKQNPKNAATANYHQLNQQDAATLNANGLTVWYDNGWFIKVKGKTIPLYSYYGFPSFHSGGIVGKTAGLTDSEMFAVLKRGELVLNDGQKKNLQSILDTLASTLSVQSVMARMGNRAYNGQESNRASGDTFTFNVTLQSNNTDTASARRFGNEIAEVALERLRTTMNRRGVRA